MADLLARGIRGGSILGAAVPQEVSTVAPYAAEAMQSGEFGRGLQSAQAGQRASSLAVSGLQAEIAGRPDEAAKFYSEATLAKQEAAGTAPRITSLRDVRSVGDVADFAMGGLPQVLTSTVPSIAGALVGRGIAGRAGSIAGALIPAYNMEAEEAGGEMAMDPATRARLSPEQIQSLMRQKGGINAALEMAGPAYMVERAFGKRAAKEGIGGIGKTIGTGAVLEGPLTELPQEIVGQATKSYARTGDFTKEIDPWALADATALGTVGGGAMSAPAGVVGYGMEKARSAVDAIGAGMEASSKAAKAAAAGAKRVGGAAADAGGVVLDKAAETTEPVFDRIKSSVGQTYDKAKMDWLMADDEAIPDEIMDDPEAVMNHIAGQDGERKKYVAEYLTNIVNTSEDPARAEQAASMLDNLDDPTTYRNAAQIVVAKERAKQVGQRIADLGNDAKDFAKGLMSSEPAVNPNKKSNRQGATPDEGQVDPTITLLTKSLEDAMPQAARESGGDTLVPLFRGLFTGKISAEIAPRVLRDFIGIYGESAADLASQMTQHIQRDEEGRGLDPKRTLSAFQNFMGNEDVRIESRQQAIEDSLTNAARVRVQQELGRPVQPADLAVVSDMMTKYVEGTLTKAIAPRVKKELSTLLGDRFNHVENIFRALHDAASQDVSAIDGFDEGNDGTSRAGQIGSLGETENLDYEDMSDAQRYETVMEDDGREFSFAAAQAPGALPKFFESRAEADARWAGGYGAKRSDMVGRTIRADEYAMLAGKDPLELASQYDARFAPSQDNDALDFKERASMIKEAMALLRDKFVIQTQPATNEDKENFTERDIDTILRKSRLPVEKVEKRGPTEEGRYFYIAKEEGGDIYKRDNRPPMSAGFIFVTRNDEGGKSRPPIPVKLSTLIFAAKGKAQKGEYAGTADAGGDRSATAAEKLRLVSTGLARLGDRVDMSGGVFGWTDEGKRVWIIKPGSDDIVDSAEDELLAALGLLKKAKAHVAAGKTFNEAQQAAVDTAKATVSAAKAERTASVGALDKIKVGTTTAGELRAKEAEDIPAAEKEHYEKRIRALAYERAGQDDKVKEFNKHISAAIEGKLGDTAIKKLIRNRNIARDNAADAIYEESYPDLLAEVKERQKEAESPDRGGETDQKTDTDPFLEEQVEGLETAAAERGEIERRLNIITREKTSFYTFHGLTTALKTAYQSYLREAAGLRTVKLGKELTEKLESDLKMWHEAYGVMPNNRRKPLTFDSWMKLSDAMWEARGEKQNSEEFRYFRKLANEVRQVRLAESDMGHQAYHTEHSEDVEFKNLQFRTKMLSKSESRTQGEAPSAFTQKITELAEAVKATKLPEVTKKSMLNTLREAFVLNRDKKYEAAVEKYETIAAKVPVGAAPAAAAPKKDVPLTKLVEAASPPVFARAKERAKADGADYVFAPKGVPGSYASRLAEGGDMIGKLADPNGTDDLTGKVVYVSVPGASRGFTGVPQLVADVKKLLDRGAAVRADTKERAHTEHNITGEGRLYNALQKEGYVPTDNGLYTEWKAAEEAAPTETKVVKRTRTSSKETIKRQAANEMNADTTAMVNAAFRDIPAGAAKDVLVSDFTKMFDAVANDQSRIALDHAIRMHNRIKATVEGKNHPDSFKRKLEKLDTALFNYLYYRVDGETYLKFQKEIERILGKETLLRVNYKDGVEGATTGVRGSNFGVDPSMEEFGIFTDVINVAGVNYFDTNDSTLYHEIGHSMLVRTFHADPDLAEAVIRHTNTPFVTQQLDKLYGGSSYMEYLYENPEEMAVEAWAAWVEGKIKINDQKTTSFFEKIKRMAQAWMGRLSGSDGLATQFLFDVAKNGELRTITGNVSARDFSRARDAMIARRWITYNAPVRVQMEARYERQTTKLGDFLLNSFLREFREQIDKFSAEWDDGAQALQKKGDGLLKYIAENGLTVFEAGTLDDIFNALTEAVEVNGKDDPLFRIEAKNTAAQAIQDRVIDAERETTIMPAWFDLDNSEIERIYDIPMEGKIDVFKDIKPNTDADLYLPVDEDVKFSRENTSRKPATMDEVNEAVEYLQQALGKDSNLDVDFYPTLGKNVSGEWERGVLSNAIRISLTAGPGVLTVAHHESMHEFFDRLLKNGEAKTIKALLAAANSPTMKRRLSLLLDGHPEAKKDMMADEEERLAYMYQFWLAGELKVGPDTDTIFGKIKAFFRRVFGAIKDEEHAEMVMRAFYEGELIEPSAAGEVLAKIASLRSDANKVTESMGPLFNKGYAFVMPSHDVMVDSDNPHAKQLGELLYSTLTGAKDASDGGYINVVRAKSGQWHNKFAEAVGDLNAEEMELLRQVMSTGKETQHEPVVVAAAKLKAVLSTFHEYMRERGMNIGFRKDYFPRVWDFEAINANPEAFTNMLLTNYRKVLQRMADVKNDAAAEAGVKDLGETPEDVAQRIVNRMAMLGGVQQDYGVLGEQADDAGYTPYMQAVNSMKLDFVQDAHAQEFMQKDLVRIMTTYLHQGVRRAEYQNRFGQDGGRMSSMLREAYDFEFRREIEKAGLTSEFEDAEAKNEQKPMDERESEIEMLSKIAGKEEAEKMAEAAASANHRFVAATHAMEGTIGYDKIGPKMRKFTSWMIAYQNLRLLPMVLFASMIDPLGMIVRGGTIDDALSAYKRGAKEVLNNWTGKESRDANTEIAERLGVVEHESFLDAMGFVHESMYMDSKAKKVSDAFFKLNGMESWNRAMRTQATSAAIDFIQHHAETKGEHAERWLEELGLKYSDVITKDDDILLFAEDFQAHGMSPEESRVAADKMQFAVNHWVDGAMLRPNAALRPSWSSDPRFALLFYLKQFTYAFQKTFLARVRSEYKHGNLAPALALMPFIPVMIASDIIRGMIQNGGDLPGYMKTWDVSDFLLHGIQRAGITGMGQFGIDELAHPADIAGPVVGQAIDTFNRPIGSSFAEATPVVAAFHSG